MLVVIYATLNLDSGAASHTVFSLQQLIELDVATAVLVFPSHAVFSLCQLIESDAVDIV
jgi:hypothetical protein